MLILKKICRFKSYLHRDIEKETEGTMDCSLQKSPKFKKTFSYLVAKQLLGL